MSTIACARLREERRAWRKDHPANFWARPLKNSDGSANLLSWEAGVPGKKGTDWEGGIYRVKIEFGSGYPSKPPKCSFSPAIFHPNVYPSGNICLSIINEGQDWKPSITLKQILVGIQDLLDNPNNSSPAQEQAYECLKRNKAEYNRKIRAQALRFAA
mmetsp:Transcript_27245/g.33212  ORF Transcript_27245/g.33212 Transcript_27245/m.33212 type:complete len:158 (+) Transcript_27245:399-872(+)